MVRTLREYVKFESGNINVTDQYMSVRFQRRSMVFVERHVYWKAAARCMTWYDMLFSVYV